MEYLDIVDENGEPTGQVIDRATAHREAIRHRTSHVWIVRKREHPGGEGHIEVLLQKRSVDKDSFPGEWDISSAGHIPAGEGFRESALRELYEELGVKTEEEALLEVGIRRINTDDVFYGQIFRDRQVSKVFLLSLDQEAERFRIQTSELSKVQWFDLDQLIEETEAGLMGSCLVPEELRMVREGCSFLPFAKG
jgi:isopentenyldiphosphate isomerase